KQDDNELGGAKIRHDSMSFQLLCCDREGYTSLTHQAVSIAMNSALFKLQRQCRAELLMSVFI
ncbi:hypothetical protein, partial [Bifidobacterium longum]|uniref:hypothetical protein n=1 Tax=Bifidobacterium longum TaxID=216816 RepID=UPI000E3901A8